VLNADIEKAIADAMALAKEIDINNVENSSEARWAWWSVVPLPCDWLRENVLCM